MPVTITIILMKWIFYKLIYAITALVLMKSMFYKLIYLEHRYLRKVDCSNFVMCLLLALALNIVFLLRPLTELTRQTRQAVHAIKESNFLI